MWKGCEQLLFSRINIGGSKGTGQTPIFTPFWYLYAIGSVYGIFTHIYHNFTHSIYGAPGICNIPLNKNRISKQTNQWRVHVDESLWPRCFFSKNNPVGFWNSGAHKVRDFVDSHGVPSHVHPMFFLNVDSMDFACWCFFLVGSCKRCLFDESFWVKIVTLCNRLRVYIYRHVLLNMLDLI